jgi:hypothetical protein
MSLIEVGRGLLGDVAGIRRWRHVPKLFKFIRTKNQIVKRHTTLIHDAPCESPCLVSPGRDGEHLTRAFLRHHRDLGFKSFIFLDNDSKDGCVSHLAEEARALGCDVTIYHCGLGYGQYKHSMKNFLVESAPPGAWVFCADHDEFLVLPDGVRDVDQIITYLEEKGFDTVQFHMLDMFSKRPFHDLQDETEWSAPDVDRHYPYFDISTLNSKRVNRGAYLQHHGGVRLKHFGVNPLLTKPTFFKKVGNTVLKSSHRFLPSLTSRRRRLADFTLFVKHYKFNSRFLDGLQRAVRENSYYDNSSECRAVLDRLTADVSYTLDAETARVYQDCEQLVACDFVTYSRDFREHLESLRADRAVPGGRANPSMPNDSISREPGRRP